MNLVVTTGRHILYLLVMINCIIKCKIQLIINTIYNEIHDYNNNSLFAYAKQIRKY